MSLHQRGFHDRRVAARRATRWRKKKKKYKKKELTLLTCHLNQVSCAHVLVVGSDSESECGTQDAARKQGKSLYYIVLGSSLGEHKPAWGQTLVEHQAFCAANVKVSSSDQTYFELTLNIFLLFISNPLFFPFYERPPRQSSTVKCFLASAQNGKADEFYSAGSSGHLKKKWHTDFLLADVQMFSSISQQFGQEWSVEGDRNNNNPTIAIITIHWYWGDKTNVG